MRYYVTLLVSFLTVMLLFPLGISDTIDYFKTCEPKNLELCENCLVIDVGITTGEIKERPVVGDYFTWNVTLVNVGNNTIIADIRVIPIDSKKSLGYNYTMHVNLKPGHWSRYNAYSPFPLLYDYSIYPMNTAGEYRILFESNNGMQFYRTYPETPNCQFISYKDRYEYVFDAMPRWEYEWQRELRTLQQNTYNILDNIRDLNNKIKASGDNMLFLTFIITILTLANVYIVWKKIE